MRSHFFEQQQTDVIFKEACPERRTLASGSAKSRRSEEAKRLAAEARKAGKLKGNDIGVSLESESSSTEPMDSVAVESAFDGSQAKGASKAAGEGSPGGSQAAGAGDDAKPKLCSSWQIARKYHILLRGILESRGRSSLSRGRTTSRLVRKSLIFVVLWPQLPSCQQKSAGIG
jgi:hypothetical protein